MLLRTAGARGLVTARRAASGILVLLGTAGAEGLVMAGFRTSVLRGFGINRGAPAGPDVPDAVVWDLPAGFLLGVTVGEVGLGRHMVNGVTCRVIVGCPFDLAGNASIDNT